MNVVKKTLPIWFHGVALMKVPYSASMFVHSTDLQAVIDTSAEFTYRRGKKYVISLLVFLTSLLVCWKNELGVYVAI